MHIPGAWHIDLSGNFATQAGWVLPPDKDIILVVEGKKQSDEAALQLHRVGFDRITGYVEGGMLVWGTAALPISRVAVISPEEAHALFRAQEAVLIDVRSREEWEADHVEGSIHIPWHDLRTRYNELDPSKQYIIMCRGGQRASIAASILKRHGISRIFNLGGGFTAYQKSGCV
jgi:rhodanese-related sulfurtransferase